MAKLIKTICIDPDLAPYLKAAGGSKWINKQLLARKEKLMKEQTQYNNKTCDKCKSVYTTAECPFCLNKKKQDRIAQIEKIIAKAGDKEEYKQVVENLNKEKEVLLSGGDNQGEAERVDRRGDREQRDEEGISGIEEETCVVAD